MAKTFGFERSSVNLKPQHGSLLYKILYKYGEKMLAGLKDSLPEKKDASGDLRKSIRFDIKVLGDEYLFQLKLKDYYKWVDEGRKPGTMPPYEAIRQWVNKKRNLKLAVGIGKRGGVRYKSLKDFGVVKKAVAIDSIRWKIYQKGISPTHFYSKVINLKLINQMKRDISKQFKKDVIVTLI